MRDDYEENKIFNINNDGNKELDASDIDTYRKNYEMLRENEKRNSYEAGYEDDEEEDFNKKEEFFLEGISRTLRSQVHDELGITDEEQVEEDDSMSQLMRAKKRKKIFSIIGITAGVLLLLLLFLTLTNTGRNLTYKIAAGYLHKKFNTDEVEDDELYVPPTEAPVPTGTEPDEAIKIVSTGARQESYVTNYLLIGIEEIKGARNTDSIMLASINTKTKQVILTSLLRDTYVEIPGYRPNKLNSAYAKASTRAEGAKLLMETIENTYHIKIDAYASVNFESMEQIVDKLGGVTIELTSAEANYLNEKNYIENPAYRNVKAGVQTLNGGQAVGYCRVRKVATLGGANNDYGRTLRQRRVLNAIFDKYRSKNIIELISIANYCLGLVRTDLTVEQITDMLKIIFEYDINEITSARLPADGMFFDSQEKGYNGITYALVPDIEANTKLMYQIIYGDTEEEAEENFTKHTEAYENINTLSD